MKVHTLRIWEELIGKLLDVNVIDDQTLVVNVSGINYMLPSFPKELISKISRNTIIGILRTDKAYAIRVINAKGVRSCAVET
ncbi:MAG: hypothetical protein ACPLOC_09030 [Candidatus Bathyarchaeales archaeon]